MPCWALETLPGRGVPAGVVFEDNEVYQNHFAGIRIRGSIPVTIQSCEIRSNGRAGIAIDVDSDVKVSNCTIFKNGRAGINMDETATTAVQRSRIYENKMAGIRIWRDGEKTGHVSVVKIADNKIYRNDQAGVRSMPQHQSQVDLTVTGNEIYQNMKAGVRVENNTRLEAKGNNIYGNGTAGIIAHESVVPPELDIYQNRVSLNQAAGIHVLNGVTGRIGIRNNWVFNNHRAGIVCGLWNNSDTDLIDVEIINNTVVSNGSSGQGAGIMNNSKGKAIVMNNILAYNYVTGINLRRCGRYSYNLLFANGDVGNCCDDFDSAPYWIESLQLGGCAGRGRGDLICDPRFVDPDNYDFRLQDNSPAIDAGHKYDDTSLPPSQGTERNDMGATGGPYAASKSTGVLE
jgi:parallel beta-helix repeat protein